MTGRFLNTMQMGERLAEDGRSSAGQKVFGELPHWQRHTMDYFDSTILSVTRSLNGKVIRANRGLRFGSCSARPTASKPLRVFSVRRCAIEMRWRFVCQRALNLARLSFMARVIFRFFPSYCAGN